MVRVDSDIEATMVRVRRQVHRAPELSNQEFETTALIDSELRAAGIAEIRSIGATGLVADIPGDPRGGVIALRADIDALPIQEASDLRSGRREPA